jgi:uncharacterized membrane protein YdbT with pleckstrin-like domain
MADEIIKYAPLGGKTLFVLIFKRCAILLLPIILLIVIVAGQQFIPADFAIYVNSAIAILWVILLVVAFFIFLAGWLEYIRYQIFIDQQSIKINRGIIREEQIGVPFRRVKEAAIERSILDQLIGISNLVMTVLGEEDGKNFSQESKIILPALDKKIALNIQDVILKRAEVEEMNIEPK